jgi:hypothetical protein
MLIVMSAFRSCVIDPRQWSHRSNHFTHHDNWSTTYQEQRDALVDHLPPDLIPCAHL